MKILKFGALILFLWIVFKRPFFDLPGHTVHPASPMPSPQALARLGVAAENAKHGVDVSHFDGDIDFEVMKQSGVHFVYMKATQGTGFIDPKYSTNAEQATETKLVHGAYHFYQPNEDPIAQAKFFLKTIEPNQHGLPPALDVEITADTTPEEIKAGVKQWLAYVEKVTQCQPMLYSNGSYWQTNLGAEFNDYPFWLADYSETMSPPPGLNNIHLWQHSDEGSVGGIVGNVDLDVWVASEVRCNA